MSRHALAVAALLALDSARLAASPGGPAQPGSKPPSARADCERLNDSGTYAEALPYCRESADQARKAAGKGELGQALTGLGLALEMTGDRRAAEASYREALALHRTLGQREREALVLSNLAALAISGGDYGGALAWLAEEEAVAQRALAAGGEDWAAAEQKYVRINRSVAFEQLGAYAEALDQLRPLAESSRSHGAKAGADASEDAALAVNLAVLYRNLGDPRRALRLLDEARVVYERLGDRSALANLHLNRGLVYQLNLRSPAEAELELSRALALARESGDRGEEIRTLCALGELHADGGRLAEAGEDFARALAAAKESDSASGQWAAEAGLGRVASAAGELDAALGHLRAAIAGIEAAGEGVGSSALRGGLLSDQRAVYAAAVDLLAERALRSEPSARAQDDTLGALAIAEQAKARELLDALAGGGSGAPLTATGIAGLTPRLGPTLVYFFGERHLWRFAADGDRWRVADAGPPAKAIELVARVHRRLARSEPAAEADLGELSRILLPRALASTPELRVVPDGRLFYLPFDLLSDPQRPQANLLARLAVSYLPSLSVFAHLRPTTAAARWELAALAAPTLPASATGDLPGGSLAGLLARRFGLPPLPAAEGEARAAAARLGEPSVVDVGSTATESRLRARAAEGARVLHIAAHTVVDESIAGGVALFLAPDPLPAAATAGDESAGDGLVSAAELAALPFGSELAVLSGCRTALADADPADSVGLGASGGRSLASLSGALLGAGARGVVASLWEVGDAATAALMDSFYFELARGERPAIALRLAKLRLAGDSRWSQAPRWAGFVLLGDPLPVAHPPDSRWWLSGGLAALALGIYLLRRGRRA